MKRNIFELLLLMNRLSKRYFSDALSIVGCFFCHMISWRRTAWSLFVSFEYGNVELNFFLYPTSNARSLQISISTSISFFFARVCVRVFVLLVYATDVMFFMKKYSWKVVFESWVRQFFRFNWNGTFASKIAHYRVIVLHFKRQRNRNEQFPLNLNSAFFSLALALDLFLSISLFVFCLHQT